jgi:type IV secretory pathway VirB10-like protein
LFKTIAMKKIITGIFLVLFTAFFMSLAAQEKKEVTQQSEKAKVAQTETSKEVMKIPEAPPETQTEAGKKSTEEVKTVAPNQPDRDKEKSRARPARGARPEIVRPGKGRPAGAGRPQGARRPGRN